MDSEGLNDALGLSGVYVISTSTLVMRISSSPMLVDAVLYPNSQFAFRSAPLSGIESPLPGANISS